MKMFRFSIVIKKIKSFFLNFLFFIYQFGWVIIYKLKYTEHFKKVWIYINRITSSDSDTFKNILEKIN